MTNKLETICNFLDEKFPNVGCELNYTKDYELLIAVMLSAQTTDKAVNLVTKNLFFKYPTLESIANANLLDIENEIKRIGLYKNKAKNMLALSRELISRFNGRVPSTREELTTLPGVGNKTAGVVMIELFNLPNFPVDTHVKRVSYRLGLSTKNMSPDEIEIKMKKLFPQDKWNTLHHQFIHFGRYFCTAAKPHCKECKLSAFCSENSQKTK